MGKTEERLLVCYLPGLDAHRVTRALTPQIHEIRNRNPVIGLRTLPSTELVPSLVAGVLPHQHRIWQVSIKQKFRKPRPAGWIRHLPASRPVLVPHRARP